MVVAAIVLVVTIVDVVVDASVVVGARSVEVVVGPSVVVVDSRVSPEAQATDATTITAKSLSMCPQAR